MFIKNKFIPIEYKNRGIGVTVFFSSFALVPLPLNSSNINAFSFIWLSIFSSYHVSFPQSIKFPFRDDTSGLIPQMDFQFLSQFISPNIQFFLYPLTKTSTHRYISLMYVLQLAHYLQIQDH